QPSKARTLSPTLCQGDHSACACSASHSFWTALSGQFCSCSFNSLRWQLYAPLWAGLENASHAALGDVVQGGDLLQAVAQPGAILADLGGVDGERLAPDVAAFEPGPAHTALDPLDDQA